MFNLGPLRLGFAQGGVDEIREMAQRLRMPPDAANLPAPTPTVPPPTPQEHNTNSGPGLDAVRGQLLALGQQVRLEMFNAHMATTEIQYLNLLMNEIIRLRQVQQQLLSQPQAAQHTVPGAVHTVQAHLPHQQQGATHYPSTFAQQQALLPMPMPAQMHATPPLAARMSPAITRHVGASHGAAIPAGSPELPEGVVIPPGWSLLPLQRVDGAVPSDPAPHNTQVAPMASHDMLNSFMPQAPNNPRSRGTSPAPGLGIFGQTGRPTTSTSSASEPSRGPGAPGPPASLDAAARGQQGPPPPVTAPTPLAPNWGGPAQLFGERSAPVIFGYQRERTPEPPGERGERSGDAPTAGAAVNGVAAAEGVTANGSTETRSGARTVTVEEADDEENEQ